MPEQSSISGIVGLAFLRALYHLIHAARIYSDNNQMIRKSIEGFQMLLRELTNASDAELVLWRSRFHLGSEKLPFRRDAAGIVNMMVDFFSRRQIGGLHFLQSAQPISSEELLAFARLLSEATKDPDPLSWLVEQLRQTRCSWVEVLPVRDREEAGVVAGEGMPDGTLEDRRRLKARNAYVDAIETVREVADKASLGMVGVRKARRLAQTIVDLICEDISLMIGLATIKAFDDYTYTHSVNVALLSTCLGRHIGMSDVSLEYLAVCGLFHDLGKVGVSKEILHKRGELNPAEWEQMKSHPLIGVGKILRLNAPPSLRSRIILGPFEHHLNPDMSGYPRTLFMHQLSLLGRILRIADIYEALTAQRAYRTQSFTPDEALAMMWREAGKSFDTILLKCFIQMIGIYPIGSVVELSDGSLALVMEYPDDARKSLPLVLKLERDSRGVFIRGEILYLPAYAGQNSAERLSIVRGVNPLTVGVHPAQFFLHER